MGDLPSVSVGWIVIVSVLLSIPFGKRGAWLHFCVLIGAIALDQFRLQPQFYFGWFFLWIGAAQSERTSPAGRSTGRSDVDSTFQICRWVLAALWFWAGSHKLLSSEWLGIRSLELCSAVASSVLDDHLAFAQRFHVAFAVTAGLAEICLGLLAIARPRSASIACVLMHVGIVIVLATARWNVSVIPWNISIALFGFVAFRGTSRLLIPNGIAEWCLAMALLVAPTFFYAGWLDRSFAGVLYSGMIPRGVISHVNPERLDQPRVESIDGWGQLRVPFPARHRCLRQYFSIVSEAGSKLHIDDPRRRVRDRYYVKTIDGAMPISAARFYAMQERTTLGIGRDDPQANYLLRNASVRRLARTVGSAIYAAEFEPNQFSPDLLRHLSGLPNIEQIQLRQCRIQNVDLSNLSNMYRLQGIGLAETPLTDPALQYLKGLPDLMTIEFEGSGLTDQGVQEIIRQASGQRYLDD